LIKSETYVTSQRVHKAVPPYRKVFLDLEEIFGDDFEEGEERKRRGDDRARSARARIVLKRHRYSVD
jgi:hypothetical protein